MAWRKGTRATNAWSLSLGPTLSRLSPPWILDSQLTQVPSPASFLPNPLVKTTDIYQIPVMSLELC